MDNKSIEKEIYKEARKLKKQVPWVKMGMALKVASMYVCNKQFKKTL